LGFRFLGTTETEGSKLFWAASNQRFCFVSRSVYSGGHVLESLNDMAAAIVERVSMSEPDALSVLAELSSRTPSPTSTDPQLTEVPLPTNIFLANPLALLISPPQATQEPFFLVESEAHNCVLSIAERLSKTYEVDSLAVLYSPTFKCYTSIVFYAAVFTELRRLCARMDESGKVPEAARAIVWAHLYTLIGVDKPLTSSSLTPALNAMAADADKLNLVEIEVLLLAFLLALHTNRHLLTSSASQEMVRYRMHFSHLAVWRQNFDPDGHTKPRAE
jgi:hypothetical protein